jgi:inner membrane protein
MQDPLDRLGSSLRNSQMLRMLSVGFLALLLQIPIAMIGSRIAERQERRDEAVARSRPSGAAFSADRPGADRALHAPLDRARARRGAIVHSEVRHAVFLPETLSIRGNVASEQRSRGIFAIPVYQLGLTVSGEFARPSFAELGVEPAAIAWDRAQLAIGVSDVRAIQQENAVDWNGRSVAFLPGTGAFSEAGPGIHALVDVPAGEQRIAFSFPLALNGSRAVYFSPFGRTTEVELASNYPHPSFQGNWLPVERTVSGDSFRAKWSIPYLGRNYPQAWAMEASQHDAIEGSRFGVDLVDPVDHYRMAERSVKYAGLFILLTFAAVWLIEVLASVRVHPIQYLLLGARCACSTCSSCRSPSTSAS